MNRMPCRLQERPAEGSTGAFAIGTSNVDNWRQLILWIIELCKQSADTAQRQVEAFGMQLQKTLDLQCRF